MSFEDVLLIFQIKAHRSLLLNEISNKFCKWVFLTIHVFQRMDLKRSMNPMKLYTFFHVYISIFLWRVIKLLWWPWKWTSQIHFKDHKWLMVPAVALWNPSLCWCQGHASHSLLQANAVGLLWWHLWLKDSPTALQNAFRTALQSKTQTSSLPSPFSLSFTQSQICFESCSPSGFSPYFLSQSQSPINLLYGYFHCEAWTT